MLVDVVLFAVACTKEGATVWDNAGLDQRAKLATTTAQEKSPIRMHDDLSARWQMIEHVPMHHGARCGFFIYP